jgi:hypothetical protein
MDLNALKRDSQGQWIDKLPGADPKWSFRVRGLSSPEVRSYVSWRHRHVAPEDREEDGSLTWRAEDAVTLEALYKVVLLEWRGLELGGKPLPYSPEVAAKLLTDPDWMALADLVSLAAIKADADEKRLRESLAKN